jgi:hypothetical protein
MSPGDHYQIHLVLGYVPWLLCFSAYVWPGSCRWTTPSRLRAI